MVNHRRLRGLPEEPEDETAKQLVKLKEEDHRFQKWRLRDEERNNSILGFAGAGGSYGPL